MTVTIHDVAKQAGVSAITVSRVINQNGYVSRETERRVREAISELNYIPNNLAKGLKSRKTSTIALLVTDITNAFWTTVARGAEDEAEASGLSVLLCNTDEDPQKENRYITTLLKQQVDGILIGPTADSAAHLERLHELGVQYVLIDRAVEGIQADVVRSDSQAGAYQMTQHLLATGYQKIAFIGGPLAISTGRDRLLGYQQALKEKGIEMNPAYIKEGLFKASSGYALTKELLCENDRPQAIFTGNHLIATGVMQALHEMSLCVPDDIAVCSFDDIPGVNSFSPFLTAVIQPAYEIGKIGVQLLLKRLSGERTEVEEFVLPVNLLIRSSCGCNRK